MEEEGLPPTRPSWCLEDSDYCWTEEPPLVKKESLSVAAVCTPHSGHMLPLLRICSELAKRGHQVKVYTTDWAKAEFQPKIEKAGCEYAALDMQGHDNESVEKLSEAKKQIGFIMLEELMIPPLRKACEQKRPDVVIADFAGTAGCQVAEDLKISLVVNVPGPLSMVRAFCGIVDTSTAINFLGLHIARQRLGTWELLRWTGIQKMSNWSARFRSSLANGALVLVQTIWGLDNTLPVYPNIVVTGPVLPPAADLREKLAAEHPELSAFLRQSQAVVYVTTGSLAKLHDWQVKVIYEGLKKAKCRVVWSLKEDLQKFLPEQNSDFLISKWTPQAELLQDEAVKVVITHCGWGGTLETLSAGKPIVAIPFFGDQPENAHLLKNAGVGELIGRIPKGTEGVKNPYKEGWMTADSVYQAVTKVLGSDSYRQAARKLQRASLASGGATCAAEHVEWAAWYGTEHLKPANFSHATGSNPYNGVMVATLALAATGLALLYRLSK
ncbi:unnamed protein product [Effrenium voratum]|nr:unnamed protein product [Effrenium voratum]